MDARAFVKMVIEQSNLAEDKRAVPTEFLRFDHVYMNLPVDAVEFLDVFRGLLRDANPAIWYADASDPKTLKLPMIHVNGFTYKKERDDALAYFVERIGKAMSYDFKADMVHDFHAIRDVSAQAHMYCTSFKLPYDVAMAEFDSKTQCKIDGTGEKK